MASNSENYEVRSAARGPHWIAWLSRPGSDQPAQSIVLIGANQAEAEARARSWMASIYRDNNT